MSIEILTDYMDSFPELNSVTVKIFQVHKSKAYRNTKVDTDRELYELISSNYGHLVNVLFVEQFEHNKIYTVAEIEINNSFHLGIHRGPHSLNNLTECLEEVISEYIYDIGE